MRTWHFYRLTDGHLVGRSFSASSDRDLARNTPAGCGAVEGVSHPHAQRVVNGELIDWQPAQPDDEHEWDTRSRRWVQRREVREAELAAAKAQTEIDAAELASLRAMRELLISTAPDSEAKARLIQADEAIAELRPLLAKRRPA